MGPDYILSGGFQHHNTAVKVRLRMYLFKEGNSHIVYCPALDLSAYGDTNTDAMKAFEDKLEITLKYCMDKNTLVEDLRKHGWEIKSKKQKRIKAPSLETMMKNNEALMDILNNKEYSAYQKEVNLQLA